MPKTYRPLDDHWVILSTSKAFNYFRVGRDEIRCAFDPFLVCRLDRRRRLSERFLLKYIIETIFHQI